MKIFKKIKKFFSKIVFELLKEDDFEKDFYRNYSKYSKYYRKKSY